MSLTSDTGLDIECQLLEQFIQPFTHRTMLTILLLSPPPQAQTDIFRLVSIIDNNVFFIFFFFLLPRGKKFDRQLYVNLF